MAEENERRGTSAGASRVTGTSGTSGGTSASGSTSASGGTSASGSTSAVAYGRDRATNEDEAISGTVGSATGIGHAIQHFGTQEDEELKIATDRLIVLRENQPPKDLFS